MRRRSAAVIIVTMLVAVLAVGGAYVSLLAGRSTAQPGEPSLTAPVPTVQLADTPTPTPRGRPPIRAQDVGLPATAADLQREVDTNSGGKAQLAFTLPSDFPKDFPIYAGARILSSIRSTQDGLNFLVAWVTDDDLPKVEAFYGAELQKAPFRMTEPFAAALNPSHRSLAFERTDSAGAVGKITLAAETTGRGKTSIRVTYTRP